jgi:hypothetical protein
MDRVTLGRVFLPVPFIFPVIFPSVLQTHLHLHVALNQKEKRAKPGNLPPLSDVGVIVFKDLKSPIRGGICGGQSDAGTSFFLCT